MLGLRPGDDPANVSTGVGGARLRSAVYPAYLALVRLRAAPGRALLVGLGIATGAAMLALAFGGSAAVRDRAVAEELARIGPSDSSLQVVWSGVPAQAAVPVATLDADARRALDVVVRGRPFGVSLFRQAQIGGAFVNLGGVDGLARWVRLRSGRLPRRCTPRLCEVVVVGGTGAVPRLAVPPRRRPRAAHARRAAPRLLRRSRCEPAAAAARRRRARGRRAAASRRRTDRANVRLGAADRARARCTTGRSRRSAPRRRRGRPARRGRSRLQRRGAARRARLRPREGTRRGSAPPARRRRRRRAAARVRRARGCAPAPRRRRCAPPVDVARRGLVAARDLHVRRVGGRRRRGRVRRLGAGRRLGRAALALARRGSGAGARALRCLEPRASCWRPASPSAPRRSSWRRSARSRVVRDAVAHDRGHRRARRRRRGAPRRRARRRRAPTPSAAATGAFLLLLPALVVFAAAVAAARLLAPALPCARRAQAARCPLRLAAVSLARRGGAALVASAFLVVSVGVALFAVSYRATLERGQRDQAAFAVPADYVLAEDLERLVDRAAGRAERVRKARRLRGRCARYGRRPWTRGHVARRCRETIARRGPRLARQAERVRVACARPDRAPARARRAARAIRAAGRRVRGGPVTLALERSEAARRLRVVPLGTVETGAHVLHARVPAGRVVALRLAYPPIAAFLAGHRESGTTLTVSNASRGVLRLGPPFSGWIGTGGDARRRRRGSTTSSIAPPCRCCDRSSRPTACRCPVLATPSLAALGDVLSLTVNDAPLTVRVVGVTPLVPSVSGDAIVADRDRVVTAVNAARPGAAVPNEVWVLRASPDARRAGAARSARPARRRPRTRNGCTSCVPIRSRAGRSRSSASRRSSRSCSRSSGCC